MNIFPKNLKSVSLFSGICGMSIGTPIMYCEIEKSAVDVLNARMNDGSLTRAPIHPDITTLIALPQGVHILEAGFPCQDISGIGLGKGFNGGKKSVLFYHIARLIKTSFPPLVFLENVDRIIHMPSVWKPVITIMASLGYDCNWCVIGAANVGAPHRRNRWFCVCKRVREEQIKHNHNTLIFKGDVMPKFGMCVNYKCVETVSFAQKAFAYANPIILRHAKGRESRGIIMQKDMKKYRWATPRCRGGTFAARNLTLRCSTDLTTQLRFATCTPERVKWLAQGNADWVEWLMGFPIGWSNPNCVVSAFFPRNWEDGEPEIDRLCRTTPENTKRLHLLGNACVRQQADFAFVNLMKYFIDNLNSNVYIDRVRRIDIDLLKEDINLLKEQHDIIEQQHESAMKMIRQTFT